MATDLETGTEPSKVVMPRPSLRITGLHIRGLKSIGSLDLPGDGMGWDGQIPDFVMVGGINGSGKTTLLEFLVGTLEELSLVLDGREFSELPIEIRAEEARIDFQMTTPFMENEQFCYLIGRKSFIDENSQGIWYGFQYDPSRPSFGLFRSRTTGEYVPRLDQIILTADSKYTFPKPSVVYFPSEGRNLVIPETTYKMLGNLTPLGKFVQRWQRPTDWKDSLPARLYALRWEDLNAKEEGRPEDATHFRSYQLAFDRFFEGRKRLKWTPKGELVVETKGGDIHDLSELSSGEKQVILFTGELLHRWRPGSLILIDEPELHLHEYYQTKLWESLVDWQKERGGQVILATQSGHLFGLSGLGTRLILNSRRAR
jgi:energy-coupling factor transporter ATP-binding protein EcfA2